MCVFGSYQKLGQIENHFCVDRKIRAHSCRSISGFIFTSNHLHSSHNTPSSSQITHSSHSPTVLSILSHTHSSPIAHPSTGKSSDRTSKHRQVAPQHRRDRATNPPNDRPTSSTGEIAPQTHEPIDPPNEWPTPRLSRHLQIDPPRPLASRTHEPISLCPSLMIGLVILIFFVLIFVSCVVYIFWFSVIIFVWILRKCEKHDKNGFSRVFSATQPNTRKYFPKHFLEWNQTLENIFLFRKYFHLKIFYTRKIFYIQPNTA